MATVPSKPHKPLHNFPLAFLKWGQRIQVNTADHCGNSSLTDSHLNNHKKPHRFRNRMIKDTKRERDEGNSGVLPERGDNSCKLSDVDVVTPADGDAKPWNLRPRRLVISTVNGNGAAAEVSSAKSGWSLRNIAAAEENEEDQKKKRRLWISLSKEEIEEDVYAFTGSRPARRPTKRNRTAQKQVDNVFPGLYLVGISADSYRV